MPGPTSGWPLAPPTRRFGWMCGAAGLLLLVGLLCSLHKVKALPSQFDQSLFVRDELERLSKLKVFVGTLRQGGAGSLPGGEEATRAVSWITTQATEVELLRFVRHHKSADTEALFSAICKHVEWRTSPLGAETVSRPEHIAARRRYYEQLSAEVFWLGVSKTGCPTLVIRTQIHDGAMYGEDPRAFTSFLIHTLEQGRRRYGAGNERKVCLLMDRSRVVMPNGTEKKEVTDMSVVPKLVELFTMLYSNLYPNYPELLAGAQVLPSSWFFSLCYRVTSRVMDANTRSKFEMIAPADVQAVMRAQFPVELLPLHLGGRSARYGDDARFATRDEMERGEVWAKAAEAAAATAAAAARAGDGSWRGPNNTFAPASASASTSASAPASAPASAEELYVLGAGGGLTLRAAWLWLAGGAGSVGELLGGAAHEAAAAAAAAAAALQLQAPKAAALFFSLPVDRLLEAWI